MLTIHCIYIQFSYCICVPNGIVDIESIIIVERIIHEGLNELYFLGSVCHDIEKL